MTFILEEGKRGRGGGREREEGGGGGGREQGGVERLKFECEIFGHSKKK